MAVVSEKGVCVDPSVFSDFCCSVCVFECNADVFLGPSGCCGGDRAPSGPNFRGLGTTTGSGWSHAGGTAGAGRSSLLTGWI